MGKGNSKVIRVCKEFYEDIWKKVRKDEIKRLNLDPEMDEKEIQNFVKDPQVSLILRKRILDIGWKDM
jgi:hypothetical protein